jgi:hypothetical protein
MLKLGGQVIMIDLHKKESPVGAPMEMRMAREDLVRQMESNGFRIARENTVLPYRAVRPLSITFTHARNRKYRFA